MAQNPKAYFFIPCPVCNFERIRIEEGMVRVRCPKCNRYFEIHVEIILQEVDEKTGKTKGSATAFREKGQ